MEKFPGRKVAWDQLKQYNLTEFKQIAYFESRISRLSRAVDLKISIHAKQTMILKCRTKFFYRFRFSIYNTVLLIPGNVVHWMSALDIVKNRGVHWLKCSLRFRPNSENIGKNWKKSFFVKMLPFDVFWVRTHAPEPTNR